MSGTIEPRSSGLAALLGVPWQRGLAWLLFLGPFFFVSYGFANHWAASRAVTHSVVFDWEEHIPFLPWTIVPYWSIDVFYGLSFLFFAAVQDVDRHALRLFTDQMISVICFLVFPLHYTFDRPTTGGPFGWMFDMLTGFDRPYNQAPSLHVSLLVILWARFAALARGPQRLFIHLWSALICASVLTTYQHHFVDVPTGVLAGLLCLWLWPEAGASPLAGWTFTRNAGRRRIGGYYFLGASGFAALAIGLAGAALWLWWPAISLALVALNYLGPGGRGFQKREGQLSLAVHALLAPYLCAAWLNSRWWTRRCPTPVRIADDVWLGRLPARRDMRKGNFAALLDLSAELPAPHGSWRYRGEPWLDLITPTPAQLAAAASHIETLREAGSVLVSCALGYSRSACAVAAWLLLTGRAQSVEEAIKIVAAQRQGVVLGVSHRRALADFLLGLRNGEAHHA